MNKTYVITGATSGIGLLTLKEIAKDNVVFAAYRSEERKKVFEEISENIYPFYLDYSKPETIPGAVEFIKSNCSKIDTVINAAGCVVAGPIEKISIDEIRKQFNVNVFGHLELSQGLADILDNGKIINISSMASYGIFPFISPYCASKRCLDILFNSFLIENKHNIKVVSIRPGVITTPLWEKSINENTKHLVNYEGYNKEMEYVLKHARENETCGLSAEKVVEVILKADAAENPKLIYTVGTDAFLVKMVSKLPQKIVNYLIKNGMKLRMKYHK